MTDKAAEPPAPQECPSCKSPLPPETVVCLHCGYDRRPGRPRKVVKKPAVETGRAYPPDRDPIVFGVRIGAARVPVILLLAFTGLAICHSEYASRLDEIRDAEVASGHPRRVWEVTGRSERPLRWLPRFRDWDPPNPDEVMKVRLGEINSEYLLWTGVGLACLTVAGGREQSRSCGSGSCP